MSWFEDDEFWTATEDFLFPPVRLEAADDEIGAVLQLVGQPIRSALDLCCGPGRHALALARRGIAVTAVDRTRAYLERARERARSETLDVTWVEGDVLHYRVDPTFDLVLNLFSSFGFHENEADNRQVLDNMFQALRPGGAVVLEMAGKEWLAANFHETSSVELPDGSLLFQRHRVTDDWSRMENEWFVVRGRQVRRFKFSHQLFSGYELRGWLEQAGFGEIRLYGDFDGVEYGPAGDRLIVVGIKPQAVS